MLFHDAAIICNLGGFAGQALGAGWDALPELAVAGCLFLTMTGTQHQARVSALAGSPITPFSPHRSVSRGCCRQQLRVDGVQRCAIRPGFFSVQASLRRLRPQSTPKHAVPARARRALRLGRPGRAESGLAEGSHRRAGAGDSLCRRPLQQYGLLRRLHGHLYQPPNKVDGGRGAILDPGRVGGAVVIQCGRRLHCL